MTEKEREDEIKNLTEWMWKNQNIEMATKENTRKVENVSKTLQSSKQLKSVDIIGTDDQSSKKYEKFTGLVNKKNDCWLNCLLQCFNTPYLFVISCYME